MRGSPTNSRVSSARVRNQTSPTSSYYRQNTDPLGKPYFNKYAHPTINGQTPQEKREELHNKSLRNLTNSRHLFEQQLETYQQTLLEQQQQTLRDFNKQIMKEIEDDSNVVNGNHNGETADLGRSESLSSLDSLEEGSNDTLRESCDLDKFMEQKQCDAKVTRNVSFANSDADSVRTAVHTNSVVSTTYSSTPQNIDSYSSQPQSTVMSAKKADEQKQQFYLQRQREIQQQLQEQKLQQQHQQDLQQKVLEQQRKQQLLLQQDYEKQQRAQLEKQRQQQQQKEQGQMYVEEEGKENFRPKAQMKAWATPSPHPPQPATVSNTTAQNLVTHASPYSGKNTHTNMTVPTYENVSVNNQCVVSSKPNMTTGVNVVSVYNNNNANASNVQYRTDDTVQPEVKKAEYDLNSTVSAQERNLSFLETVTNDLTIKQESKNAGNIANGSNVSSTPVKVTPSTAAVAPKAAQPTPSSAVTSTVAPVKVSSASSTVTAAKPPVNPGFYVNSYGAVYAARQQMQQQQQQQQQPSSGAENKPEATVAKNTMKLNGAIAEPWSIPGGYTGSQTVMLTPNMALNGDDIADTDSVSTICEDREPETKGKHTSTIQAGLIF